VLATALALGAKGMAVLPCYAGSKKPATPHGYKDATRDAATIENWWKADPNYNVAIATGEPSGVFVLDVDGVDGEAALRKLEDKYGKLPASVESITGGGGRHVILRMPDCGLRSSVRKFGDHLDIRANGGFAVMPPSIHETGRRYCWSVDSASTFADAPAWLVTLATNGSNGNGAPKDWPAMFAADVAEGARDDTLTRFAGHLLRRYVAPQVVLELLQCWNVTRCAPPLPPDDVYRIVNSIAGKELRRRNGQ